MKQKDEILLESMVIPFMRSLFRACVPAEPLFLRFGPKFAHSYPRIAHVMHGDYWHWNLAHMEHRPALFDKHLLADYITVEFRVPPVGDELLVVFTEPGTVKYSFWTSFHKNDMYITGEYYDRPTREYRELEASYCEARKIVGPTISRAT